MGPERSTASAPTLLRRRPSKRLDRISKDFTLGGIAGGLAGGHLVEVRPRPVSNLPPAAVLPAAPQSMQMPEPPSVLLSLPPVARAGPGCWR